MPKNQYAILLAGGQGSRFWPQSRVLEPKQFLALYKNKTLFEETLARIRPFILPKNIFVVTPELYHSSILELVLPCKIPEENIVYEPEAKNTAPAIALAARLISLGDQQARVCVFPCDHMIKHKDRFIALLAKALRICQDNLVVLGIPPHRPATGYGYIRVKGALSGKGAYAVDRFLEKPKLKQAEKFFRDKRCFWNSGVFIGSCRIFLAEIKLHLPRLYQQLIKINNNNDIERAWKKIDAISFDYGVLEKSRRILMLKASGLGWSDLGSWQAWDEFLAKDKDGNALKGDVINLGSKNTSVLSKGRLIATIGLEDLIIVDTPDALLITKKEKSEEVKKVVEILKKSRRQEQYLHRTVKRPWGSYTVLDSGLGFKVKLVEVKPRNALSLQLHRRRSEHWVVVKGRAKIVKGKNIRYVNANESTFIPVSCVHRLINPTDSVLKIVEVQAGDYLQEDDIVRLKDNFGRKRSLDIPQKK